MRSTAEIVARINEVKAQDFFGAQVNDLLAALPFADAQPFLKAGVTAEQWQECHTLHSDDDVRAALVGYLPFAFEKAHGERGISASRSLDHMRAYTWLLGDEDALAVIEDDDRYAPYGLPVLTYLAERFGAAVPTTGEPTRE